jgi:hypothetical protein
LFVAKCRLGDEAESKFACCFWGSEVNGHQNTTCKPDAPVQMSLGQIKVEAFEQDVAVNDRHQSFSAELLRLSLLGVGGVGYIAANSLSERGLHGTGLQMGTTAKWLVLFAAVTFGLSAGSALSLRYISSDLLAFQLRIVRLQLRGGPGDLSIAEAEEARRNRRLKVTRPLLVASSAFLALGAAIFIAFLFMILRP